MATARKPSLRRPPAKSRKIVVLGSRNVGKSSLTVQFVDGHFVESYYPTIENTFRKSLRFRNHEYDCQIVDTAGQDEYSLMSSRHAIGIHGYVLVYSVTSRSSLDMAKVIREKILNHTGTEWVPMVLVGNKADLQEQRQVSKEEAMNLAAEWKCAWTESSARENVNVMMGFELCIEQIEVHNTPRQESKRVCIIL